MRRAFLSSLVALAMLGAVAIAGSGSAGPAAPNPAVRMALAARAGQMPPRLPNGNFIPMISGAMLQSALETEAESHPSHARAVSGAAPTISAYGCPNVFTAAGVPDNVRATTDCGFRSQSEEWVQVNPTDPNDVIVSQNDSKLSGNHTGVDFSVNGGKNFGDSVLPAGRIFIPELGTDWSFDFFSDPMHAFDTNGNLYYVTIGADFAQDGFSGLFAWKSNSCEKGATLHTPGDGSCGPFSAAESATAIPIVTNFSNPNDSPDKELFTIDTNTGSPYKNTLYVTYTNFRFDCGSSGTSFCDTPIQIVKSTDGGQSWSNPVGISGNNPAICNYGNLYNPDRSRGACDFNQDSSPVIGPDGTIYVFFRNFNVTKNAAAAPDGMVDQILMVKSSDGGTTWSRPSRVSFIFDTMPYSLPGHEIPDCSAFRHCLAPNGYRMSGYPSAAIDPTTGELAVFFNDFRNGGPCDTFKGLAVLPCQNMNNDVFVALSQDGGSTWTSPRLVSGNAGTTAQWQQWGDIGPGGALYVAYYDRGHGNCEQTGCNDITLATSTDAGHTWSHQRITTSSMPNLTCAQNPFECGFLGDYMGLQVKFGTVHIVWGDTRGRAGQPDEDVYYASVPAA